MKTIISKKVILMIKNGKILKGSLLAIILILVTGLLLTFTSCTPYLAIVNGYKITQKEVDNYTASLKSTNPDIFKEENKTQLQAVESQVIDYIIVNKLLEKYASENGISVLDSEVEKELQSIKDSFETEAEFSKYIKDNNIDEDFLKIWLKNQILGSKIYEKITKDITLNEEEAKKYYEENMEAVFKNPEQVKVSHILVRYGENDTDQKTKEDALEKIKAAQQELQDGESFENVAKRFSEDENTNVNGGELGYFAKGQLMKEFEEAAFKLSVGEVSDIVETSYGFHIIKVTDKTEESITPYDEVKDQIIDFLTKNLKSEKWQEFIIALKDKAEISYSKDFQTETSTTTEPANETKSSTEDKSTTTTEPGAETESTIEEKLITPTT